MVARHQRRTVPILTVIALSGSFILLTACDKAHREAESLSIHRVSLIPDRVQKGENIELVFEAVSRSEGIELDIEWIRNGLPIEEVRSLELSSFYFQKGDTIRADLRLRRAGNVVRVFELGPVVCINSPPALSDVAIYTTDSTTLVAKVDYEDVDEDEVTVEQKWYRNGVFVHEGETLTTTLRRGDTVVVEATPYDADAAGRSLRSAPITVGNHAPKINSDPPGVTGDRYIYYLDAADSDGDELSYRIDQGPGGMTVDSKGVLSWSREGGADSIYTVAVEVVDGHGGSAVQTFELKVTER